MTGTGGPAGLVQLADEVRAHLARGPGDLTPFRVAAALRTAGHPVGDVTVLAVHDLLRRDVVGAGPLEPLLREPGVSDVLVNGPDEVWVDRGAGLVPADLRFPDDEAVRRLAQRLAATAGRRLDDAVPHVDARLPDGTRFHAVLAPLARPGTLLSLRVPPLRAFTLAELAGAGSLPGPAQGLLRRLVAARAAFLVSGGTGSGKTTLLAALLGEVSPTERLVLVEDSSELRPSHPHVVGLEARPANVEGAGEVSVRTLVRQALRMRPDRLVVGEVRGAEVTDLLAALNTGHEGGCGTVHANGARDVPARLEALALAAGMGRAAVHAQTASAIQVVLHVARDRTGRRALATIGVTRRDPDGTVQVAPAVSWAGPDAAEEWGPGEDRLAEVLGC